MHTTPRSTAGTLAMAFLILCAPALGADEKPLLTKAQAGKVEVSKCYRQCFADMATQDRGPILREDEGSYGTEYSSWTGVKRCMAAVQSQYFMEQCSKGCEDLRDAYGGRIASRARTRYLAAQRARRSFLQGRGLLPVPSAYTTFDKNCYDAWDGKVFYGLRWRAWSSDPGFAESSDDSAALPVGASDETGR